ncbi:MAG: hypothetical protein H7321_04980, partial [Bacteroidia bacterium]|nr:hypothetical protein [Bacteroidia bacterium]
MKFHSLFIISTILISFSLMAKDHKDDSAALVVTKVFSKNEKTHIVELREASDWSLEKLNAKVGGGEEENSKYDICFKGDTNEVMEILKAIVEEGNKNSDRKERVIFNLAMSDIRYKGFP